MDLRSLKKVSQKNNSEIKKFFVKNLIVGDDFSTLIFLTEYVRKNDLKEIKLIRSKPLDLDLLHFNMPTDVRGQTNIDVLKKFTLNTAQIDESKFFKEGKLKNFKGRSKGEKLLEGEEYYVEDGVSYSINDFIDFSIIQNSISSGIEERIITKIKRTYPTEILEKTNWDIVCADDTIYSCENLIFADSPKSFIDLIEDEYKNKLSDSYHELCHNLKYRTGCYLTLNCKNVVSDETGTIFIPQSFTHENGHFIGQFDLPNDGEQKIVFFAFVGEDETSEDLSQKIRLMKRSIAKVFEKLNYSNATEKIVVSELVPCDTFNNSSFDTVADEVSNLFFIGPTAPVLSKYLEGHENGEISHFSRTILSIESIKNIFS